MKTSFSFGLLLKTINQMKMMTKFIAIGFILSMTAFFNHYEKNISYSKTTRLNTSSFEPNINKAHNTFIEVNEERLSSNNPFIFIENSIAPEIPKNKTEVKKNTLETIITSTVKRFFNYCVYKFPIITKLLLFIK